MPRKTVSMEEAFQELDTILEQLEGKDISLEDSFALYQKGMELVKTCNSKKKDDNDYKIMRKSRKVGE